MFRNLPIIFRRLHWWFRTNQLTFPKKCHLTYIVYMQKSGWRAFQPLFLCCPAAGVPPGSGAAQWGRS